MIITDGTITIPTTPICTGIPGVPSAGASAWDSDTRDGGWVSPLDTLIEGIIPTTVTVTEVGMIHGIPGVMVAGEDITPVMDMADAIPVMAGEDTTQVMARLPLTDMAGSKAGTPMDIQIQPGQLPEILKLPRPVIQGTGAGRRPQQPHVALQARPPQPRGREPALPVTQCSGRLGPLPTVLLSGPPPVPLKQPGPLLRQTFRSEVPLLRTRGEPIHPVTASREQVLLQVITRVPLLPGVMLNPPHRTEAQLLAHHQ